MKIAHQIVTCSGLDLEVQTLGEGRPLLYLHGGLGPDVPDTAHLQELARNYRVIAPRHPGFGHNDRPAEFRDVGDLAYLYLDLIAQLDLQDGILMGASFGGWVACEMLIRKPDAMAELVLSAPLGIKVRGREDRDIADIFAMTEAEFHAVAYADPAKAKRDIAALNDDDLAAYFRAQESLAAYSWEPYMHNPQLSRWLHRITLPTLLISGDKDRFVFDGYHAAFAQLLPHARHVRLADAGHFPHVEKPAVIADLIRETFAADALSA